MSLRAFKRWISFDIEQLEKIRADTDIGFGVVWRQCLQPYKFFEDTKFKHNGVKTTSFHVVKGWGKIYEEPIRSKATLIIYSQLVVGEP